MAVATHQWTSDGRFAVARTVARTGIAASAVIVITTLLAEAPFLSYAWQVPMGRRSQLFLFLAPSALPVAIPIGLTLGLIVGLEGRVVSRHVVRILLGFAVVASMFSFIDLAWIPRPPIRRSESPCSVVRLRPVCRNCRWASW